MREFRAYVSKFSRFPVRLVKGMNIGTLRQLTTKALGPNKNEEEPLLLLDKGYSLGEGEGNRGSPLFAEAMDEHKDSETGAEIFASWEDRIASSLHGLHNQSLSGKAPKMLRRHQAMWSGHLGEVTATEHASTSNREQNLVDRRHTGPDIVRAPLSRPRSNACSRRALSTCDVGMGLPVVIVPKYDGSTRFCVDYRKLKESTIRHAYSIPRMDDCIDSLREAKIFTTLDCNSGYWQIPIHEADRKKQRSSPIWVRPSSRACRSVWPTHRRRCSVR